MSKETGGVLHRQNKYSKSLSWAENLNFLPKSVSNLFKFSAQDSDLEYLFWQCKKPPVSSDIKPPLKFCPIFDDTVHNLVKRYYNDLRVIFDH